jgi:hypothetical protein
MTPFLAALGGGSARGFGRSFRRSVAVAAQGQQAYTTAGTYTFVVPAGVTSVSILCVGGAQAGADISGGAGGYLSYTNSISCSAGETFAVVVGAGGTTNTGNPGANSNVTYNPSSTVVCRGRGGADFSAAVGTSFSGGAGSFGGGGAGGYSGAGGAGAGTYNGNGADGAGGGAGGGGAGTLYAGPPDEARASGAGGGVGILGTGASGAGGSGAPVGIDSPGFGGGGGSGGAAGDYGNSGIAGAGGNGGLYGGGGGGGAYSEFYSPTLYGSSGASRSGAVRIIWGAGRSYPSNAANV